MRALCQHVADPLWAACVLRTPDIPLSVICRDLDSFSSNIIYLNLHMTYRLKLGISLS